MLRRIQGRPRWTQAAGPNGNIGERTVSFFRFRERVGIHTSAQHATTLSKLEERGMRDHTMCCRLPHIIRSGMPRKCDDGCIGRGRKLRQRQLPLRVLSWEPDALARRSDSDRLVDGRIGLGWSGQNGCWVQYPLPYGGSQHERDDMLWTSDRQRAERSLGSAPGPGEDGSTAWD